MVIIATHSGSFHADDTVGCAILVDYLTLTTANKPQVVRTRNPAQIADATYALDVGGIWDVSMGRFDHHQKGFTGARSSGVIYASAGLIWAEFGPRYIKALHSEISENDAQAIAQEVDDQLIQYVDMADTGAANMAPDYYGLSALISSFNLSGSEERNLRASSLGSQALEEQRQTAFEHAYAMATILLRNIIKELVSKRKDASRIRNSAVSQEGQILILEEPGLSWMDVVCTEMPKVLYVIYPDSSDQQWQVRTVPTKPHSFSARKDLPKPWAGLRDAELVNVTGVADAVFCHNGVFIAGALSRAGALALATLALHTA